MDEMLELYKFKGRVINTVDGDTIDAEIDLGFKLKSVQRLRLLNLDTPERGQGNWADASWYTTDKLLGKDVIIQTYKSDVFGRYLANIFYINDDGIMKDFVAEFPDELKKPDSKYNTYGGNK